MAIWTLAITLRFREMDSIVDESCLNGEGCISSVLDAFKMTMKAGHWILVTPFALIVIMMGLHFDSCMRMIITLASQYYRIIQLPEASFGLIASGISMLGFFVPKFSRWLVKNHKPGFNLTFMSIIMFIGLIGMVFVIPFVGIIPLVFVVSVAYTNDFFVSHYLNQIAGSEQRATVLSFKGLSFNLAYGITGLLYSLLMAFLREQAMGRDMMLSSEGIENLIFTKSLYYFPPYFIVVLTALLIFGWLSLRKA